VLLPTVVIQCSGSGAECAGELCWRETRDGAMAVVVIPKCLQLSRQIDRVPEEDAVQVLAPDRADQTLNERMRNSMGIPPFGGDSAPKRRMLRVKLTAPICGDHT